MAELNKLNKKSQKRNNRAGFLFLLPLIVIFIGLLGYSFYFLSVNSFRDVTITFRHTEFTGLANYKTVLTDLKFWRFLWIDIWIFHCNRFKFQDERQAFFSCIVLYSVHASDCLDGSSI